MRTFAVSSNALKRWKRVNVLLIAEESSKVPYALIVDTSDNRVRIEFDDKPNSETCKFMRKNGFVFSRQNMAWQRQLNQGGLNTANWTAAKFAERSLYN